MDVPRPRAVGWYYAYCWFSATLHGIVAVGLAVVFAQRETLANEFVPAWYIGLATTMLGSVAGVFAIVIALLPKLPRTPNSWTTHLVNILLGCGTCVLTPICLPLFFAWMNRDVRAWFGDSVGI